MTAPLGPPIITGVADLVGGLLGNNSARSAAADQRKFEAQMSGSAYQRAVKDMRAAGLNPALAYGQGGASTPSAGIADVGSNLVGHAVSTGRDVAATQGTRAVQAAQVGNLGSSTAKNVADAALSKANTAKTAAETRMILAGMPRAAAASDFWSQTHQLGLRAQDWLTGETDAVKNAWLRATTGVHHSATQIRNAVRRVPGGRQITGMQIVDPRSQSDRGNP